MRMNAQRTGTWLAAFAAALLPLHVALAQTADQDAFKKYINAAEHGRVVAAALESLPHEVFQRCPALVAPGSRVTITKPITMSADGKPTAGAWWQRFPVSGCGNDTVLNLYFAVSKDGKVATNIALPGTTRADLVLQHDALFYAGLGPRTRAKDCKSLMITNTKFESYGSHDHPTPPPAEGKFQPWWETWTVKGCGHTFSVPMDFAPDATGTQIKQRPSDIHEL
jgi:hypothetical protein